MLNSEYDRAKFIISKERTNYYFLVAIVALAQVIIFGFNRSITAQIIPDSTLGAESSVVTPDQIEGIESELISGGAVRGNNLFHSFQEFNVNEGRGAYFDNPAAIQNIFSRVTGNNLSQIMGTLGVLGNANLFLMNPNGILFGRNARLDIRGSFLATTSDSILFPDGKTFSALNPESPPLLTVNVQQPIGLQLEGREGLITNQGILAVDRGQNLGLVGGNLVIDGGSLIAPGGRVDLGGLTAAGIISINNDGSFSFPDDVARGDISFLNGAVVGVFAGGGGFISMNARNLEIRETAFFAGIAEDSGSTETQAGDIVINATDTVIVSQESLISNQVESTGVGNSGGIEINADNVEVINGAQLTTTTSGQGNSGLIRINAKNQVVFDGQSPSGAVSSALSQVQKNARGDSGGIEISGGTVAITNGGQLSATTLGQGDSGLIKITGTDKVVFDGESQFNSLSSAISQVLSDATGNSGGIEISGGTIEITNGAFLDANTLGLGNAGAISLNSSETVLLDGESQFNYLSSIRSQVLPDATGDSGGIEISGGTIEITNGASLDANTLGLGDAGAINLNSSETVLLDGESINGVVSSIRSQVLSDATGNSGGIEISGRTVAITNGGQLSATTLGQGDSGLIKITGTDKVVFDGESQFNSLSSAISQVLSDATGNSGGIEISGGTIEITNGAFLDANTLGLGNAGVINLNSSETVLLDGESINGVVSSIRSQVLSDFTGVVSEGIEISGRTVAITNGGQLSASTLGQGDSGLIKITGTDKVVFNGESQFNSLSSAISQVLSDATGDSGGIEISGGTIEITNGAFLDASTLGLGDAGAINLNSRIAVLLDGESINGVVSSIRSQVLPDATGDSGGIEISGETIEITNGGQLSATTLGQGDSGLIKITGTDKVVFDGESQFNSLSSAISQVLSDATGNSEGIEISGGTIEITNGAFLDASTLGLGDAGAINLNSRIAVLLDGESINGVVSSIRSQVLSDAIGDSEGIEISGETIEITNGGQLSATTLGQGDSGLIKITGADKVVFDGESQFNSLSSAISQVLPGAIGDSGGIEISGGTIEITNGAFLDASTLGLGDAGAINLNSRIAVLLDGESINGVVSSIRSQVLSDAIGDSEGIEISGETIEITNGGQLSATTLGQGDSGLIKITGADKVVFDGESQFNSLSSAISQVLPGAIGDSGGIEISGGTIEITNGAFLDASTLGLGNAGAINLNSRIAVLLDGESINGVVSSIRSQVGITGEGKSEGIEINADNLYLSNGGIVSASTSGQGEAGDIHITANILETTKGSQIQTNTNTNFDAADITLEIKDNLFFSGSSSGLFAQTEGEGDAGDIKIDTLNLTMEKGAFISALTESSGDSGTITVNAEDELSITDSSELTVETRNAGKPGNIVITTPKLTIGKDAKISATVTETSTNTEGGGSITINTSNLDLTGELGIFAETQGESPAGTLDIQPYTEQTDLNITFSNTGIISSSTTASGAGGDINLTAPETISISGLGKVTVETSGSGDAGDINIETKNLNISNQTEISASTSGTGSAGEILVLGTESVILENSLITTTIDDNAILDEAAEESQIEIKTAQLSLTDTEVSASTNGVGDAGDINLEATSTLSLNNTTISSAVEKGGEGTAGVVEIKGSQIALNNANISSSTAGDGNANSVTISAAENLELSNTNISSAVDTGGVGNGNNVELTAPSISVRDNSEISTATNGKGNAGTVNVTADETISISGSQVSSAIQTQGVGAAGEVTITAPQIRLTEGSEISSSTAGEGSANSVIVEAERLEINSGGKLRTSTATNFEAGNIILNVQEQITLSGEDSGLFANTELNSTGKGGSILIREQTVETVTIQDGAEIAVDSQGSGEGGIIELVAENLILDQGKINAETTSNQGGDITLTLTDRLNLRNESQITATAGTERAGGDGGNITIDAPFIIAFPQENSDITANAFEGDGGNINITTQGIFGIEFRNQETALSDITASSRFGQQGIVEIDNSGVDPTRGLNNLPQQATETEVAQSCQESTNQVTLAFFDIGRGGLPPTPEDLFSSDVIIAEWMPLNVEKEIKLQSDFTKEEISQVTVFNTFLCQQQN